MRSEPGLEKKIGYSFRDGGLLEMALTHASVPKSTHNNERLEFLGDRVLGLVVAEMLYRAFPQEKEGPLAKRHAALVQRAALATVAEEIGLFAFVRASAGETQAGEVKKETILADAVEALIGALYLDGGFEAAQAFVFKYWEKMLQGHGAPPEDPKTRLQEWAQAKALPLPEYTVISAGGADHAPVFEISVSVAGHGSASARAANKRGAEKEAARRMLDKIGGEA